MERPAPEEYLIFAKEVIQLINDNADALLKDNQPSFCGGCAGPNQKYVYRSPAAYRIGQLIETMRRRGHLDYPRG